MNRSSAPLASPSLSSCAHSLVPAPRTPAGRGGVPRVGLRALTVALTLGVLGCGASNDCESLRICSPDKSAEDNAKTEDKGTKTDGNAQKDDKKSPDNGKNADEKQTEPKEPSGAPGGSGGHAGEGDETPLAGAASSQDEAPYLVRVSPKRGAQGVRADAEVQLTFSEAMNKRSVERSLSVADYLPGELNFSWNEEGTIVRIVPQEGFAYATGENPQQTPALEYRITQGRDALDLDGEKLKRAEEFSFTTLRRFQQALPSSYAGGASTYAFSRDDEFAPTICSETEADFLMVGSHSNSQASGRYQTWVTFDISTLGGDLEEAGVIIEEAIFQGRQMSTAGDFYEHSSVTLSKLAYQKVNESILDAKVEADLGAFCTDSAIVSPELDITSVVAADFAAGKHRQLYRLSPVEPVANTRANFECNSFRLDITYLIP